jgi:hypothetical protein
MPLEGRLKGSSSTFVAHADTPCYPVMGRMKCPTWWQYMLTVSDCQSEMRATNNKVDTEHLLHTHYADLPMSHIKNGKRIGSLEVRSAHWPENRLSNTKLQYVRIRLLWYHKHFRHKQQIESKRPSSLRDPNYSTRSVGYSRNLTW